MADNTTTVVISSRHISTHDTEANWKTNGDAVPNQGEIIVYDIDDNYNYERIKVGDGVTSVKNLPFASVSEIELAKVINTLQQEMNTNKIHISETKPSYACTWFRVTSITE